MNHNIKKILIKTKKAAFSEIIGNNSSLFKGEGYDFLELKEYEYGEDVKNIDWVISAKMQKPYVKVFHDQKELNISIVPILNGSVYFGTKKFKQELITEICATLGFSSIKQGDSFDSFIANEDIELQTKRSKNIHSVYDMTQKVFDYNPINKNVNYKELSNTIFKNIKRRSIIFLIGDFFDAKDLDLKVLAKKHEVVTIIVRDNFEENPVELSSVTFKDPMMATTFEGNISASTIKEYKSYVRRSDHILYEHLQDCGIKFTKIYTYEEPFSKLIRLFND